MIFVVIAAVTTATVVALFVAAAVNFEQIGR
jgi:hypothetical protein